MKFNFKIQEYQTEAVNATVKVFAGQHFQNSIQYRRDVGSVKQKPITQELSFPDEYGEILDEYSDIGYKNDEIILTDTELLKNIQDIQNVQNIKQSPNLIKTFGQCALDIDMETGTGKTYVYIKTMFELNKLYGWTKFIVVVPSIAIREGVKKSFEITVEHFMQHYGKKARFFVYNSSSLNQIDTFSSSSGINVMIINTQAFAKDLKEGSKTKAGLIMYDKRDEFQSRRPIDVIKANRPILILDEPQKMGGEATQKGLKNFNPLFALSYSATHIKENNTIYALDALEAYNKKLVKKIEVKGFEVKNFRGTDCYLYLESIVLSPKKPPRAKIEIEINYDKSINRETRIFDIADDIYIESKQMEQYKDGYVVSEIDPITATVTFTNGQVIKTGEVVGDISEKDMRRIQIRETILSHFEKEESLFNQGIKTLSLFFIDEVAKYRQYDENGEEQLGEYGIIFEQEYKDILNQYIQLFDSPYQRYLKEQCLDVKAIHKGYFSIDKKTGKSVNGLDSQGKGKTKANDFEDDISAYDLILKNKERLLSFEEPTRFIFSHSALREGWDNPNVFQICTLKHSDSKTLKRQEVGRGLRICVNQDGKRMDKELLGDSVHDINKLTVIASESYQNFVSDLQKDLKLSLYDRPTKATIEYFEGKTIMLDGQPIKLDEKQAKSIYKYLAKNDYTDDDDNITTEYHEALEAGTLAELPEELKPLAEGVHKLIQSVYDESILKSMFDDAGKTKIKDNPLNDNFHKKEFQSLWNLINHQYAYTVKFKSEELIKNSIKNINENLYVSQLKYTRAIASQKDKLNEHEVTRGDSFGKIKTKTVDLKHAESSQIKYDLIGKIAEGTTLTRKTVATILKGLAFDKIEMFQNNPEEFISKVIKSIKAEKAQQTLEHISYNQLEEKYESTIFTMSKNTTDFQKAFHAEKHIQDYVFTDGTAEISIERTFAEDLDSASEVCVYAKLPKTFHIPTPVGNYSPDWAIAFNEDSGIKHIYFIAETKGSMDTMEYRKIEDSKIKCAKKLFNEISTNKVRYSNVGSYKDLLDVMKGL